MRERLVGQIIQFSHIYYARVLPRFVFVKEQIILDQIRLILPSEANRSGLYQVQSINCCRSLIGETHVVVNPCLVQAFETVQKLARIAIE